MQDSWGMQLMVDGGDAGVVRTLCQLPQRKRKKGPSPPLPPLALIPS